jgi:uncharacterized protein
MIESPAVEFEGSNLDERSGVELIGRSAIVTGSATQLELGMIETKAKGGAMPIVADAIAVPQEFQDLLIQRLNVSLETISSFRQGWKIIEFGLFGSILRDDFRAESDVDVLVTFEPDDGWSLFDLTNLQRELAAMVERSVDLLEKRDLKNPFRRAEILNTYRVLYVE